MITATLSASAALAISCSRSPDPGPVDVVPVAAPLPDRRTPGGVVMPHDFGMLRPSATVSHQFTLRNDTAGPWTFDSFQTSCGCTVAEISAERVPPGGATTVTLSYKAPDTVGDDRRAVGVKFKEDGAPAVRLAIQAKVREPVSLFPILLRVQAGHDRPATAHIEVCSYVPEMTAPPALAADAPWAVVGVPEPLALPADDPAMSRRWQVPVTLATDKLGPGEFRCEVAVPAGAKHGAGVRVPVELRVAAPITVSPGQLFFGTVAAGKPTSVTFAVRTPVGHPVGGVTVEHDLGSVLAVRKTSPSAGST